jgi:uncharacterized membrane protein
VRSLALARGFTVFFIPIIHAIMLYGNEQTHNSDLVSVLAFIAEWPGAQLFMLLMGIYFALSKNTSVRKVMLRSIVLLAMAYLLNFLKYVPPGSFRLLPDAFLNDIQPQQNSLLLIGDILHFAALALPLLFLVKKLPEYPAIAIIAAFIVCFATPLVIPSETRNLSSHFFSLIVGQPPHTYFPLFPWLVYPLAGLAIGYYLKREGSKTFLYLLPVGLCLMSLGFWIGSKEEQTSFYRTGPWHTMQHMGFVCSWLTVWHIIARIFKYNWFFRFLASLSRGITLIYIIQWPLICWLLPVFGYHQLNMSESIIISLTISLTVFGIAHLLMGKNQKPQLSSRAERGT